MGSGIQDRIPKITEGSNGIQDLLSNFTIGSDWIMDLILHLVERSSGIIDPTLGSTDMSGEGYTQRGEGQAGGRERELATWMDVGRRESR